MLNSQMREMEAMRDDPHIPNCRFCRGNHLLIDAPIYENRSFYLLSSLDPETAHGTMVISHRHVESPFSLNPTEWEDFPEALEAARNSLSKWQPDGYTVGWNVGRAGGQSVEHAHLHVFARFALERVFNLSIRSMLKKSAPAELREAASRRADFSD